jgi:hypothetical protein
MSKHATAAGLVVVLLAITALPADARGGHGFGHDRFGVGGHAARGEAEGAGAFSANRRHGNDDYTTAASDEEDRLLNTKLKSICGVVEAFSPPPQCARASRASISSRSRLKSSGLVKSPSAPLASALRLVSASP